MLTDEASRLEKLCGMDASSECGRRPDRGSCAEWTPASELSGVQLEKSSKIGRRVIECEASNLRRSTKLDAV